jgi:ATP-dependent Clp protease ATP-binding subunit ClpC
MYSNSNPDFKDFLNHLTDNALASLKQAEFLAHNLGDSYVGTFHLFFGILSQESSLGYKVLEKAGINFEKVKNKLSEKKKIQQVSNVKGLSETAKLTLKMAYEISQDYGQNFCGTEHIVYSLLTQKNSNAVVLLKDFNVDTDAILQELNDLFARQQNSKSYNYMNQSGRKFNYKKSILETYGTDLTKLAKNHKLDPVIGRDVQIHRLITILNRRTKNNPVLIGEPGVGKTAIVEGLAQKIINEDVPESLLDHRIIILDLAGMIAGTKYRGEFEDRLKKVMSDLSKDHKTIIFIDEIHLIVGAGAAEGAMDAGNILKPALARGDIRLIGATTTAEYTKYIEKDSALERRFQPIQVPETNEMETIAILKGLRKYYESFHGVIIKDDVIELAAQLAKRYIHDRFMPDKAIDLIDEASAHLKIIALRTDPYVRNLQKEIDLLTNRIEEAVESENYELAAKYKTKLSRIEKDLTDYQSKKKIKKNLTLTKEDLNDVIARMTGIPVSKIISSEASYLLNLEKTLSKKVIGQQEAVKVVSQSIRRSRSGIASENHPIGSFVFLGPSGVGKTELARVLAREFYGNSSSLIKIDMSEFSESYSLSRLLGAPAGYIGYDQEGQLTDKIRRQPYSLVLFDEIEKAHPDIFNILLQILEDGYLSDSKGRKIDFTNTVIIMTSNLGANLLKKEINSKYGFTISTSDNHNEKENLDKINDINEEAVVNELNQFLRPELLNRIDKVIVFNTLSKQDIKKIIDLQINDLNTRLSRKGTMVHLLPVAKKYFLDKGYDQQNGVRPLKRLIQTTIEDFVSQKIIAGQLNTGDIVEISVKNNQLSYKIVNEQKITQKV